MKKFLVSALMTAASASGHAKLADHEDYRKSITDITWQIVISDLLFHTLPINQLYGFNDQYSNYDSWNRAYTNEP